MPQVVMIVVVAVECRDNDHQLLAEFIAICTLFRSNPSLGGNPIGSKGPDATGGAFGIIPIIPEDPMLS